MLGDPHFRSELSGLSPAYFQPGLSVTRATRSAGVSGPQSLHSSPSSLPGVTRNPRAVKTRSRSFMAEGLAWGVGGGLMESGPATVICLEATAFIGSTQCQAPGQ